MTRARLLAALAVVHLCSTSGILQSQVVSRDPASTGAQKRVGLVLSGGVAKGIAHIGVLRVLEEEGIFPEIVTGTSMGALVGGLYAIGHTPAGLDSLATRLDWNSYFLDEPAPRWMSVDRRFVGVRTLLELPLRNWSVRLPSGVISGQRISELLSGLTWPAQTARDFTRLPRRFNAIGTDIETGETMVLDSGSLALALRASMSMPGLFDPVRLGGRLVIDGGTTRNLPARDARALGADIIICSDVSDPLFPASRLQSLLDVVLQTITIYVNAASEPERLLCDVLIQPRTEGLSAIDFDEARAWIDRGVTAAASVRERLRSIARDARRQHMPAVDSEPGAVRVSAVEIEGVSGDAARYVRQRLRVAGGSHVTPAVLEAAVQRVHATELFDRVGYRLDARGPDTVVVVTAEPRQQDHVGVGVRYDDAYDASLLFTVRLRNRIGFGSSSQLDVRLGEQLRVAAEHVNVGINGSRFAAGAGADYSHTPVLLYTDSRRTGKASVHASAITAFGALLVGDAMALGVEVKGQHAVARAPGTAGDTMARRTFASASLRARSNTLDRAYFPTAGHMLSLRSEYAFAAPAFEQHVGHLLVVAPVARRLTVLGRASVGVSSPEGALPLHYAFMLGGTYPSVIFPETQVAFVGLRPQERVGAALTRIGAALQWEPSSRVFATLRADAGRVGSRLAWDPDDYTLGIGASLGALTPVGPIELSGGLRPSGGRPRFELTLGYPF